MADPENTDGSIIVKLSKPLERSDGESITEITVMSPNAAMMDKAGGRTSLYQMADSAYARIMPRITTPQITPNMYMNMPINDSQKLINAVMSFLVGSSSDENLED